MQTATQSAIIRTFSFTILSLLLKFVIGFSLALMFNLLKFPLRKFARSLMKSSRGCCPARRSPG